MPHRLQKENTSDKDRVSYQIKKRNCLGYAPNSFAISDSTFAIILGDIKDMAATARAYAAAARYHITIAPKCAGVTEFASTITRTATEFLTAAYKFNKNNIHSETYRSCNTNINDAIKDINSKYDSLIEVVNAAALVDLDFKNYLLNPANAQSIESPTCAQMPQDNAEDAISEHSAGQHLGAFEL